MSPPLRAAAVSLLLSNHSNLKRLRPKKDYHKGLLVCLKEYTMKRGIFISCLVVGLLFCLNSVVMAEAGNIQFGNLKIIPSITVQEVYDDNIYLQNGSNRTTELKESDWITHIKPGIVLDYTIPGKRGKIDLGYQGDLAYYRDNDNNDWDTHTGFFNLDYSAPGGFILGIDEVYTDTSDPYSSDNQYRLGQSQTERWFNTLKTKIGYGFSKQFRILAYYNYYKQDYDLRRDYTQDYSYNEFGVGAEFKLFPKTWGFVRYHYGECDYFTHPSGTGLTDRNDSDFDWHRINVGLNWETGAKLGGELNFGYQWKDYDNPTDVNGTRYDDRDTWLAATSMFFKATSTTTLFLDISRAIRDADSNTNLYYEDTGIGLTLQQKILRKFTLIAGGSYSINDYNQPTPKDRDDDNYKANIDLTYKIQEWLSAGIGYYYWKKDSNYRENDFTDNQFKVSVSLVY